jgi:hypothetical protein
MDWFDLDANEPPANGLCGDQCGTLTAERVKNNICGIRMQRNESTQQLHRLRCWVLTYMVLWSAVPKDIPGVVSASPLAPCSSLLGYQHQLVAVTIVVTESNSILVPDDRLLEFQYSTE